MCEIIGFSLSPRVRSLSQGSVCVCVGRETDSSGAADLAGMLSVSDPHAVNRPLLSYSLVVRR